MRDEVFEEFEGGRVQPLEIIEKECKGMLFSSEHAQKGSEHSMKTALGFCGWNFWSGAAVCR